MTGTYFVLIARDDNDGRLSDWGIQFGDYDLQTVRAELEDYADTGAFKARNMKIIATRDDQAEIDRRVGILNAEIARSTCMGTA